jgi:uncharacterized protein YjeT (DUF2065 family)
MSADVSVFLAQSMGIVFSLAALSIFFSPKTYLKMVQGFSKNTEAAILFRVMAGFFALILGTIMVLFHNIWTSDWRFFVTLIAWITLLKGITILLFPEFIIRLSPLFTSEFSLRISAILLFLLGLFFWYSGFAPYFPLTI